MIDWTTFFKDHEDYVIRVGFYENHRNFTMEELYQAFKGRLMSELWVTPAHEDDPLSGYGRLEDTP